MQRGIGTAARGECFSGRLAWVRFVAEFAEFVKFSCRFLALTSLTFTVFPPPASGCLGRGWRSSRRATHGPPGTERAVPRQPGFGRTHARTGLVRVVRAGCVRCAIVIVVIVVLIGRHISETGRTCAGRHITVDNTDTERSYSTHADAPPPEGRKCFGLVPSSGRKLGNFTFREPSCVFYI